MIFAPQGAQSAAHIRANCPLIPEIALVLGSGLGALADMLDEKTAFPFATLPGFPPSTVSGHDGALILGRLAGVPVALLSGRVHYYEKGDAAAMATPIETLAALGCRALILTNAAGSLQTTIGPGSLMLITDHINFAGTNPLFGAVGDARFVGLSEAYDPGLGGLIEAAAQAEGIALARGVYMWFSGPSFETPAEIRAARILGADAVGMSTVPEVILARYFGLKVAAISTITNLAAGMGKGEISHEETKAMAPQGAEKLKKILPRALKLMADKAYRI